MAVYGTNHKTEEDYFSSLVLKVNPKSGWQKTVAGIVNVHGVKDFHMKDGEVQVAGMVYPPKVLAALAKSGKKVQVESWKYGQCSKYLELPSQAKKKILEYNRHGYGNLQEYPHEVYGNRYYGDANMHNGGYGGGLPYMHGYGQSYESTGYGIPVCNYQSQDSSLCQCSAIQGKKESSSLGKNPPNTSRSVGENASKQSHSHDTSEMPVCCTIM